MTRYGGPTLDVIHRRLEKRYRNMAQQLTDKDDRERVVWTGTGRTRKGLEPAVWMTFGDEPSGEHVYFVKWHYTTTIGRFPKVQAGDLADLKDVSQFNKKGIYGPMKTIPFQIKDKKHE